MSDPRRQRAYVTRAGEKLATALRAFSLNPAGRVCADLGSHEGGFVDCLLKHGAARVYSVDTSYGTLAWALRRDPRVVVLERTNAMHVSLPERIDLTTIDVGWTRLGLVLPNVARWLKPGGRVVALVKPHYEADPSQLRGGVLDEQAVESIVGTVLHAATEAGWDVRGCVDSPLVGHGGNREVLAMLARSGDPNPSLNAY
ncbi:MAG: 16S/23S rRNA (cytidine-2'-O)-methyltransferase TlyA [Phycisphaerae bacterium]|nr:16S/23S rRNA (cytidine-2'-O)-methyltransferase TlyA [Phycisphaerae bacterium]